MTKDVEGSKRFCGELFGWTTRTADRGMMGQYTMILASGNGIGGIVPLEKHFPYGAHRVSSIPVLGVAAAVGPIGSPGGTVCSPGMHIRGVGRFSVSEDPHGASSAS